MSVVQRPGTAQSIYFGKLASRADFVRSGNGVGLIQRLDDWMARALALMSEDARWKLLYDEAAPVHFALLGPAHKAALIGYLVASHDTSGRRFPFVRAASLEVSEPLRFTTYCGLALVPIWHNQQREVNLTLQAPAFSDAHFPSQALAKVLSAHELQQTHKLCCAQHNLGQLAHWLSDGQEVVSVRQALLALGLLLQPLCTQGCTQLSKGLSLPLPSDDAHLGEVLSLWISLILPFFRSSRAELALLVTERAGRQVLLVGFHGASPVTLRSALDPGFAAHEHVDVLASEWVESAIANDYGVSHFSGLLQDPTLSWALASELFYKVFLGEGS